MDPPAAGDHNAARMRPLAPLRQFTGSQFKCGTKLAGQRVTNPKTADSRDPIWHNPVRSFRLSPFWRNDRSYFGILQGTEDNALSPPGGALDQWRLCA